MASADVVESMRVYSPTDEKVAKMMFNRGLSPPVRKFVRTYDWMNIGVGYINLRTEFPDASEEHILKLLTDYDYNMVYVRECLMKVINADSNLVRPVPRHGIRLQDFDDDCYDNHQIAASSSVSRLSTE